MMIIYIYCTEYTSFFEDLKHLILRKENSDSIIISSWLYVVKKLKNIVVFLQVFIEASFWSDSIASSTDVFIPAVDHSISEEFPHSILSELITCCQIGTNVVWLAKLLTTRHFEFCSTIGCGRWSGWNSQLDSLTS